MSKTVEIEILVAPGCGAREQTEALVADILASLDMTAQVRTRVIEDARQAAAARFPGSPTVRVNGQDVEPAARSRKEYGMG
ncbi:hypothetical protein ACLG6S_07890 [Thermodesulfobacteriota bacterium B35]